MNRKPVSHPSEIRNESKIRYLDAGNIEKKWLDQYGNISIEGNYQRNRSCLSEVFNMLDVVMELCIEDFRKSHAIINIEPNEHGAVYTFEGAEGEPVRFQSPSSFAARVIALRAIGYGIPNDLFYDTRVLRNETTHGNQTIVLEHMQLSYEDTKKAMLSMADTLILLGKLDPSVREPSFEMMRVREGDILLNGVYTVGPKIGEGGMSRVYKATQKRIGRDFALKELKPETFSEEQIRHECEVLSSLRHKQIPQIYDVFYENATYYIVMSLIDGINLDHYAALCEENPSDSEDPSAYLSRFPKLTDSLRLHIAQKILDVLEYLHDPKVSIVFADLSPDNIMIDQEGTPYLIDFGISSPAKVRQEKPAATLGYSAPEVFIGASLDQRADIYSFGYVLRFLYSGLSPMEEAETPTLKLISDRKIANVINRCTAKYPFDRYASVSEVRQALVSDSAPAGKKPFFRHFLPVCVLAAVVLVIFSLASRSFWSKGVSPHASSSVSEPRMIDSENSSLLFEESGLTDHPIDWHDENLEKKMREITGIEGRKICLSDIWSYTVLNLSFSGISDISALCECSELKELYLGHNSITDLSALRELTDLTVLELQYNPLNEDPDPLSNLKGLTKLTWLDINNCSLSDLSALSSLTNLTSLDVSGNQIPDLSALHDLSKIEYLDISGNLISDIGDLSELKNMIYLNASGNEIVDDLKAVSGLIKLNHLDLHHNQITDISDLAALTGLKYLDVSDNPIPDLSILDRLPIEEILK